MKRKNAAVRWGALALAVCCMAALLVKLHVRVLDVCARAAAMSAVIFLPAFAVQQQTEATQPTQAALPETKPSQPTQPATKPAAAAQKGASELTETPADILALMKQARKGASRDEKGGAIYEKQYTNEGVTDSFGAVRIKNTNKTKIDPAALLAKKADLSVRRDQPAVLIFHTHTTETYQLIARDFYAKSFQSRSNDAGRNMVRIGDAICEQLEEAGFLVLHDTEIHDAKYTGAYAHSRDAVAAYQKQYPSLQVLLDIHRDAIQLNNGTKIKPTATIGGKKAAQVMIISGCQESGNGIEDFPDWRWNLIFALQLQERMETLFPGLTRPLFFCPRRYNMNMSHNALLLEIGSDANTLEEAEYAARCVGKALGELLNQYREDAS